MYKYQVQHIKKNHCYCRSSSVFPPATHESTFSETTNMKLHNVVFTESTVGLTLPPNQTPLTLPQHLDAPVHRRLLPNREAVVARGGVLALLIRPVALAHTTILHGVRHRTHPRHHLLGVPVRRRPQCRPEHQQEGHTGQQPPHRRCCCCGATDVICHLETWKGGADWGRNDSLLFVGGY